MSQVPVNETRPRAYYLQDDSGSLTEFGFSFPVLDEKDLRVAVDSTVLSDDSYSVTLSSGEEGGWVTFNTAPSPKSRVTIWREMAFERVTEFAPGSDLRASVLNDEFDRTTLLMREVEALVGDSIHRQPHDPDIDLTLPSIEDRAGYFLSFDAEGRPEAVQARIPGDFQNFALIYSGPSSTAQAPTLRLNGTALQNGDLYFNTDENLLKIRSNGSWITASQPTSIYLPLDGSAAMSGNLNLGGNNLENVGTVDGQDLTQLTDRIDQVDAGRNSLQMMALNNAWELARIDGTSAYSLANTYLDAFEDETGIDRGTPAVNALAGKTPSSNVSMFNGSYAAMTDGSTSEANQMSGGNNSGVNLDFDMGDGNEAALVRFRLFHFGSNSTPASMTVQASPTGTYGGEEITLATGALFDSTSDNTWGEITWNNDTIYRYWRFTVDSVRNTSNTQRPSIAEVEAYPKDISGASLGYLYNTTGAFYTNLRNPVTVSSTAAQWEGKTGSFSHGGDEGEDITASSVGAIRSMYPLSGDFDFEWTMANVTTDRTWRMAVAPISEWENFDKNATLGGFPANFGGAAETIRNGVALSTFGNRTDLWDVSGNTPNEISNTLPAASNGDKFRISRTGSTFTACVNDAAVGTFSFLTSDDVFLILGSDGANEYYFNTNWTGYPYFDAVPTMSANIDHGIALTGNLDKNGPNLFHNFDDPNTGGAEVNDGSFVTVDFGSGGEVVAKGLTLRVNGEEMNRYPTGFSVHGSNDDTNWTLLLTVSGESWNDGQRRPYRFTAPALYRYYRWTQNTHSGDWGQIRDFEFLITNAQPVNMTLASGLITASSSPGQLRSWVDLEILDGGSVNTDFLLEVSRDDGATWTETTLSHLFETGSTRGIFEGSADLTGVAPGSSVRMRFITKNLKGAKLHRWALQADQMLSI